MLYRKEIGMAIINVKLFSLNSSANIELFTLAGEKRGLDLVFFGQNDAARREDDQYAAWVPVGKYFLISPCADGSVNLSRVQVRESAGPVTECIAKGVRPIRDEYVTAFAGLCSRENIPESVARAYLTRLERPATQDYIRPSSSPTEEGKVSEADRDSARRY